MAAILRKIGVSAVFCVLAGIAALAADPTAAYAKWADVNIGSFKDMSVDSLRARTYGSDLTLVDWLGKAGGQNEYQAFYSKDGSPTCNTYMAAYRSDGLRVYARVDIPTTKMPEKGYPVVVFIHGWAGVDAAPKYGFNYAAKSYYGDWIDAYVKAGYVVVFPGWRGHGTVSGVPADGIEFMKAFDNGSYVSPLFYAIDVLNAIDSLQTLQNNNWAVWGYDSKDAVKIDLSRICVAGHSQGGDVELTTLAVAGKGSKLKNKVYAASIWSGCFPDRITQLNTYGPMENTWEAFKAGSQDAFEWNGTAVGSDGSTNPNFVFGYPPEWIGTVDPSKWDWQKDEFVHTYKDIILKKTMEMYDTFNNYFGDGKNVTFSLNTDASGKVTITHDPAVLQATAAMSAFNYPEYFVGEKLILNHSDEDMYSMAAWNADLTRRITAKGGYCINFVYPANTHELNASDNAWYNHNGKYTVSGRPYAIKRDIALFDGSDPTQIAFP